MNKDRIYMSFQKEMLEELLETIVGRIMAPKDDRILISRIYEYIRLHGKGQSKLKTGLRLLISWYQNREIILNFPDGLK